MVGEVDDNVILTVCRNDQLSFNITFSVRNQAYLGDIGNHAVGGNILCRREGLQGIIAVSADIPVVIQFYMIGIFIQFQLDLEACKRSITDVGDQDVVLFFKIIIEEDFPEAVTALICVIIIYIQLGAAHLADDADLVVFGMSINDGYHVGDIVILGRFALTGEIHLALSGHKFLIRSREPDFYSVRITDFKNRDQSCNLILCQHLVDHDCLIAIAIIGIHVDGLAVFHDIGIKFSAIQLQTCHMEPGILAADYRRCIIILHEIFHRRI